MDKKNILRSIQSLIAKGDEIIDSIDLFIDGENWKKDNQSLYDCALMIRKEYIKYAGGIFIAIKKYGLNEIDESVFKPHEIKEIPGGMFVLDFIDFPETKIILEDIKRSIIDLKKELRKVAEKIPDINQGGKGLDAIGIKFDEKSFSIVLGDERGMLELEGKEFILCKFMFAKNLGEFFSWDEPFGDMESEFGEIKKKMVYDIVLRINKKIKKIASTDDELFRWKKKEIARLF